MIKTITAKLTTLLLAFSVPIVLISGMASAEVAPGCSNTFLGIPTWYKYLDVTKDANGACAIDTSNSDGSMVLLIIMGIFDILMFLAGLIAVIMVIYGGFRLVTSTGEPQKIAAARTTILNALIGLGIAILASQVVGFVAGRLS